MAREHDLALFIRAWFDLSPISAVWRPSMCRLRLSDIKLQCHKVGASRGKAVFTCHDIISRAAWHFCNACRYKQIHI